MVCDPNGARGSALWGPPEQGNAENDPALSDRKQQDGSRH
jgi:hypothetical protein